MNYFLEVLGESERKMKRKAQPTLHAATVFWHCCCVCVAWDLSLHNFPSPPSLSLSLACEKTEHTLCAQFWQMREGEREKGRKENKLFSQSLVSIVYSWNYDGI